VKIKLFAHFPIGLLNQAQKQSRRSVRNSPLKSERTQLENDSKDSNFNQTSSWCSRIHWQAKTFL